MIYSYNFPISVLLYCYDIFSNSFSHFLANIKKFQIFRDAFNKDPELSNLLLDDFFRDAVHDCQIAWRDVIAKSVEMGIPTPAFSTALAFYDGYRSEKLPANLIQVRGCVIYIRYFR